MKKIFYIAACLLVANVMAGCGRDSEPSPGGQGTGGSGTGGQETPDNPDNPGGSGDSDGWTLVFEDDFENEGSTPDASKWVLCQRGDKSWNRYLSESYDQAYIQNGSLYLTGELSDGQYLTGGIESRGKFDFMYGKLECRARFVSRPQGNHTGIWMMPSPPAEQWPKSGEIDIMEHLNDDDIIYETVHSWYIDDLDHKEPKAQQEVSVNREDWNIYGLVWTENSLTYTVNGQNYLTYDNQNLADESTLLQWPFNHNFYIILSQSLGGEGTWEGPIDNSELPAIFEIDYVKVWQQQ